MSSKKNAAAPDFDVLDGELARWLRARGAHGAMCDRDDSPLDDVAMALRKLRAALSTTVSNASDPSVNDAPMLAIAVRTYRWAIRMARELYAIEELGLDALTEWTRFEAFAPFALAFFHSLLGTQLAHATDDMAVARLRRDIDVVLSPFLIAMTSSSMAA
jgi:hypothetical protein